MKGTTKDRIWYGLFWLLMVPSIALTTPLWIGAHSFILAHPVENEIWQVRAGGGCLVSVLSFGVPLTVCAGMSWAGATWIYRKLMKGR